MSQILNLKISNETFEIIMQQAKATGTSPDQWVSNMLEKQYGIYKLKELEKQKARERFESHFGEVNLGYSTGTDNKGIDEDLAREYIDTHEES